MYPSAGELPHLQQSHQEIPYLRVLGFGSGNACCNDCRYASANQHDKDVQLTSGGVVLGVYGTRLRADRSKMYTAAGGDTPTLNKVSNLYIPASSMYNVLANTSI